MGNVTGPRQYREAVEAGTLTAKAAVEADATEAVEADVAPEAALLEPEQVEYNLDAASDEQLLTVATELGLTLEGLTSRAEVIQAIQDARVAAAQAPQS